MILLIIGTIIVIVLFFQIKPWILKLYYLGKLPGPQAKNFLLGNVNLMHKAADGAEVFTISRQWATDFPTVYQTRIVAFPALNIVNPYDAEKILSNPVHMEKSLVYEMLEIWLETGLLTSSSLKWQTRRKILTPAFHFNILKQYCKCFNDATLLLITSLRASCHKPYTNITEDITQYTLRTISETALGTTLSFASDKENLYKQAIDELHNIFLSLIIRPWYCLPPLCWLFSIYYRLRSAVKVVKGFTAEIIKDRTNSFQISNLTRDEHDVYVGKRKLAMLDLLLFAKIHDNVIDDKGIQEEVDTFTFEGHDTTSIALQFAILLLANHREVQEKILEETAGILNDEPFENLSYNHLQDMKYLDCVLKEVLRLYPSVHFISRKAGEDFITHDGYFIPKHSMCHMHIYDIHRNPKYFPDPHKFDPNRFLPENSRDRHPFAYIPFSAGLRNCIGQKFALLELKTAIVGILRNFVLKPIDTPLSIVMDHGLILRPIGGIRVKLEPRNQ